MQDWRSRGLTPTAYGNLHRLHLTRVRAFTGASRQLLAREPAVPYRASISRLALVGEIVPLLTRHDIGGVTREISWVPRNIVGETSRTRHSIISEGFS